MFTSLTTTSSPCSALWLEIIESQLQSLLWILFSSRETRTEKLILFYIVTFMHNCSFIYIHTELLIEKQNVIFAFNLSILKFHI